MTSYATSKTAKSSSSRGCGGANLATPSKCSCGSTDCAQCDTASFVRPRFFAGQLLTEDDLQALGEYVAAKNRLHNRYLFGDGVVCGLAVSCHPCGGGTVIVDPGYALDCCGNDIVVECATELDILAMIRELRRNALGGYDCGDPCEESASAHASASAGNTVTATPVPKNGQQKVESSRHYCLYVRYCEELTDPVSAYATNEPCGYQTCEPTRLREGYRFELRCPSEKEPHDDLFTRIFACFGDPIRTEKSAKDASSLLFISKKFQTALQAMKASPEVSFDSAQLDQFSSSADSLHNVFQPQAAGAGEFSAEALHSALENTRIVASNIARYSLLDDASRAKLEQIPSFQSNLEKAKAGLQAANEKLGPAVEKVFLNPLDRAYANAILNQSGTIASQPPAPAPAQPAKNLIAYGAFFTPQLMLQGNQSLESLKEDLLERLESSTHLADCELRELVRSVVIPAKNGKEEPGAADAQAFTKASETLVSAYKRYLRDCVCAAFNPPCRPCDDTAVLLACLEVKDCVVTKICNLKRQFVIAPATLRYWLPFIGQLGEEIERECCPADECRKEEPRPHAELPSRDTQQPPAETPVLAPYTPGKMTPMFSMISASKPAATMYPAKTLQALAPLLPAADIAIPTAFVMPAPAAAVTPVSVTSEDITKALNTESARKVIDAAVSAKLPASPENLTVVAEEVKKQITDSPIAKKVDEISAAVNALPSRDETTSSINVEVAKQVKAAASALPTRAENDAAISAAVDTRVKSALSADEMKKAVSAALNDAAIANTIRKTAAEEVANKLPPPQANEALIDKAVEARVTAALAAPELRQKLIESLRSELGGGATPGPGNQPRNVTHRKPKRGGAG